MQIKKTAFITGASEGLGRRFAKQLATQNFNTVCVARNEIRLQELVNELGLGHTYLIADLNTEDGIKTCTDYLHTHKINLLINNAGFSEFGLFREADINNQMSIFHVNCHATLKLSHAFLQQAGQGDALINLSSITNTLTTPIQPVYCATKCFTASFSESLWFQERERGIYVQALLPGITRTQFIERASNISDFKMKFLNAISQSPETVVKCSLKALEKRNGPIIVPGIHNQLLLMLLKFLPRRWIVWGMGKAGNLA